MHTLFWNGSECFKLVPKDLTGALSDTPFSHFSASPTCHVPLINEDNWTLRPRPSFSPATPRYFPIITINSYDDLLPSNLNLLPMVICYPSGTQTALMLGVCPSLVVKTSSSLSAHPLELGDKNREQNEVPLIHEES